MEEFRVVYFLSDDSFLGAVTLLSSRLFTKHFYGILFGDDEMKRTLTGTLHSNNGKNENQKNVLNSFIVLKKFYRWKSSMHEFKL